MKILAIETTGHFASVALGNRQLINSSGCSHLQELSSMVLRILDEESVKGEELDLIAVSRGPGSFTGIRIGMATAKALAQIWDKPIVTVPTLEAFAYRKLESKADLPCTGKGSEDKDLSSSCESAAIAVPVFDARRSQVYAGIYRNQKALLQGGAYDIEVFKEKLSETLLEQAQLLSGCGSVPADDINLLPVHYFGDGCYLIGEESEGEQEARQILELAELLYNEGRTAGCFTAEPEYMRKAEAERKLEEKNKAAGIAADTAEGNQIA